MNRLGGGIKVVIAFLIIVTFFGGLSFAQKGGDTSNLKAIKSKIEQQQKELKLAERELDVSFEEIQRVDYKIAEIDAILQEIMAEVIAARGRIVILEDDLNIAEEDLEKRQEYLQRHLKLIYKQGRYPMVRILISVNDFSEFSRKVRYLSRLAEEDRRLSRAIKRHKEEIEHKKLAREEELENLTELQQMNEQERYIQKEKRDQKRVLIEKIKLERTKLMARLKELKKEKRQLEALLKNKMGKTKHSKNPLKEHGKIDGPTNGTIIRPFGEVEDSRYGTTTINDGVDIRAPLGRDVNSVLPGEVIYADWFKGYGKTVIVDHGNGLTTIYSHVGDMYVAPGDRVSESQVIGTVGDTGYVDEPMLHFEIRHNAEAIDPQKWLNK